jgi:hypothetical protein
MQEEAETFVAGERLGIRPSAGGQVIDANYAIAVTEQISTQMMAEKSSATRDQRYPNLITPTHIAPAPTGGLLVRRLTEVVADINQ